MKNEIILASVEQENTTLTVYEGKALEPKPPVKVILIGNIKTVSEYLKKRYRDLTANAPVDNNGFVLQKVDPKSAIIIVDEEGLMIDLKLDPENPYGTEVTGKLEFTKYLEQFHINEPVLHKREELVKILRFSKPLFEDAEKYEELLKAYQTFDFKAHIEAMASSDTRGNKAASIGKKVTTNLPESFIPEPADIQRSGQRNLPGGNML